MIKFACIKDPHYKFGFSNSIRRNYNEDIFNKNKQLIQILKDERVNHLLIPGDVFDESYGNKWRFQAYQINKEILKEFLDNMIQIIAIPGNHDYFDGYEDSARLITVGDEKIYQYTVYGDMVNAEIIKDVSYTTEHPKSIHGIIINNIYITGVRYRSDLNIVRNELEEINSKVKSLGIDKVIVMLHQNVTLKSVSHITEFTYDELSREYPNIDVFLLGHYHIGYEPMKVNNTWFINPYNFTRVNRDYEVRLDEHIPEVAIIEIDNDEIKVKQIKLKVKPFKDTFIDEYREFLKLSKESFKDENIDINLDDDILNVSDEEIISIVSKKYKLNTPDVINYVTGVMNNLKTQG